MLKLVLWVPYFENHCTTTCWPLEGVSSPIFESVQAGVTELLEGRVQLNTLYHAFPPRRSQSLGTGGRVEAAWDLTAGPGGLSSAH